MKKINALLFVTFVALAGVAGCEDEPEPSGVAGGGGGGAGASGGGGAGTGGAGSRQPMPADTAPPMSRTSGSVMVDAMGRTMAPVAVATPPMMGGSSAEATIPMGSQFLDSLGTPVSGMATIELTSFNTTTAGEAAFMSSVGVSPEPMGFTTLGVATVRIKVGTTEITSASNGVDLVLHIPTTAYDTTRLLRMGERFDFKALNSMDMFVKVGEVTLPAAMSGTYEVAMNVKEFAIPATMGKRGIVGGAVVAGAVIVENTRFDSSAAHGEGN